MIREGATCALDPDMSEADALAYWTGPDKETFVAEEDGVVLGAYYLRPNQVGGAQLHGEPAMPCAPCLAAAEVRIASMNRASAGGVRWRLA